MLLILGVLCLLAASYVYYYIYSYNSTKLYNKEYVFEHKHLFNSIYKFRN